MCRKLVCLAILSFVPGLILTSPAQASDSNLVAHWNLDDGAGTIAIDSSGNGNDGTLVGDPQWVAGKYGGALDFDGDGDYVDCGDDEIFSITDAFTLAVWINWRTTTVAWQTVIAKGDNTWRIARGETTQTMDFGFDDGSRGWAAVRATSIVPLNEWHHVAATIDKIEGAKIYMDGILEGTNTDTGGISGGGTNYPVYIGENAEQISRYWDGLIDDIYIFNRVLAPLEIHALMVEDSRLAWDPTPANGEVDILLDQPLIWSPGIIAGTAADLYNEHQIYIGTDFNEVDAATVPIATVVDVNEYTATLDYDTTYYWRVDEVGDDGPVKGNVWSFTTANFISFEDFESYSDDPPNEIWNTWIDGFGTTTNGATAGYPDPDFIGGEHYVETAIVHGGNQSMPVFYDNRTAKLSEVTKTLTSLRDWTVDDVITLTLFYYGDAGNTIVPMYFAVNDNAVSVNDTAKAVLATDWTQWDISMQVFADQGVNLSSVSSISIGFGDKANPVAGGVGHVFFDDIRLNRSEPVVVEPEIPSVNPGTANLVCYYAFENNTQDTSGRGNNATIAGNPTYVQSATGYGTSIALNGAGDYLTLPIGQLISTLNDSTFAAWVNWSGGSAWQRIFDFGSGEDINMFLTPNTGSALRFAITNSGNTNEDQTTTSSGLPTGWHHIAVTIDPTNTTHTLYLDGKVAAQNSAAILTPSSLGVTTQNWIGLSQYAADPYYVGSMDEFRIYNKLLTRPEVLYLAGK